MAKKYRKIDPRIWNDKKFAELSERGQLIFLFGLTHPHLTSLGAMRNTIPGLASERKYTEDQFLKAFNESRDRDMVRVDKHAPMLWYPNFLRYNPPESPNAVKGWDNALTYLPECKLRDDLIQSATLFARTLTASFTEALPQVFGKTCPIQEQELRPPQEQELYKNQDGLAPSDPNLFSLWVSDLFNKTCTDLNCVISIAPETRRYKHVMALKEAHPDRQWWMILFSTVHQSDFLSGRVKDWQATFDWIVRPTNIAKIVGGEYAPRGRKVII